MLDYLKYNSNADLCVFQQIQLEQPINFCCAQYPDASDLTFSVMNNTFTESTIQDIIIHENE